MLPRVKFILKTQIFHKMKLEFKDLMRPLLCYGEVAQFLITLKSFDKITTLTYIIVGNFCPCFKLDPSLWTDPNPWLLLHPYTILRLPIPPSSYKSAKIILVHPKCEIICGSLSNWNFSNNIAISKLGLSILLPI